MIMSGKKNEKTKFKMKETDVHVHREKQQKSTRGRRIEIVENK